MADDEVLFSAEADLSNVDKLSDAQLDALIKALEKRGFKAKEKAEKAGKKPGAFAGAKKRARGFGAAPVSRFGATALAVAVSKDTVGPILEVAAKRFGTFVQASLPQWMNPILKTLGVDKESIGKDIGSMATKVREAADLQIARVTATLAATNAGLATLKAAGATGVSVSGEDFAKFALVDYQNSMIDAQLRDHASRRATRRTAATIIDGAAAMLGSTAGKSN